MRAMTLGDVTNLIVAITSIVAILLAVFTFWQQMRQSRTFLGIQILREWESHFFWSEDMRRRRYVTCKYLEGKSAEEIRYEDIPAEAWEILDTFDGVGMYVSRGVVDEELAWATFYYWLNIYWYVLQPHRELLRAEHAGTEYLKDIDEMYARLTDVGTKRRGLAALESRCSPQRVARFIEEELRATGRGSLSG
jgi:hypothetical protein